LASNLEDVAAKDGGCSQEEENSSNEKNIDVGDEA
jgi:hypothetical protein